MRQIPRWIILLLHLQEVKAPRLPYLWSLLVKLRPIVYVGKKNAHDLNKIILLKTYTKLLEIN